MRQSRVRRGRAGGVIYNSRNFITMEVGFYDTSRLMGRGMSQNELRMSLREMT